MTHSTARAAMARAMTEDELLAAILEAAPLLGWRAHHVRNSKAAITQGDKGYPDVTLARYGQVVYLELKSLEGRLTEDQWGWLLALEPGGGHLLDPMAHDRLGRVTALVVRPPHLDHVLTLLAGGASDV